MLLYNNRKRIYMVSINASCSYTNASYICGSVIKVIIYFKGFFSLLVLQCNNNWFKFQHMLCICPRINDHHYYTNQSNGLSVFECICVLYMLAAPRALYLLIILVSWSRIYMYLSLSLYADHARALLLNFSYAISNYSRGEYAYMSAVSIHLYSTLSIDAIIHTEPTHHHNTQSITNQSRKAR